MKTSIHFTHKTDGPDRLVCEAEIHFAEGLLGGLKLVGFTLWKSPEGEIYVMFPSRAFGSGTDRRYFDFLRSIEGVVGDARRLKTAVLDAYRVAAQEAQTEQAVPEAADAPF